MAGQKTFLYMDGGPDWTEPTGAMMGCQSWRLGYGGLVPARKTMGKYRFVSRFDFMGPARGTLLAEGRALGGPEKMHSFFPQLFLPLGASGFGKPA